MASGYDIGQHSYRWMVNSKDKDYTYLYLYPWYPPQDLA